MQTKEILSGLLVIILLHLSIVSGTGNNLVLLDDCICPNHNITFECTTVGGGITVWQGSAFSCPQLSDEISLRHAQFLGSVGVCNDGAICAHAVSILSPDCFISNLTVYITPALDGRTVRCEHDNGSRVTLVRSFALNITSRPLPGPLNVTLADASPQHLTFSWTPISKSCRVQSYAINSSSCGVCPSNMNMTTARCTGFQVPAECTFTVRTIVCENLVSTVGSELTLMLQVPSPPRMINYTLFYSRNNTLSRIISTFAANLGNANTDTIDGSTTSYTITYSASLSGLICGSRTILSSMCINGTCIQEFDTATSSCSLSDDIVIKVFASNIFGNGPSSLPIVKGGTNNFARVEAQSDHIICTFLNAQEGEKSCSVVYGHNCQHLDSEILTGQIRGGDSVIVPLLQNTEAYCYFVTAISGDTSVNLMGNFHAEDVENSSARQSEVILTVVIMVVVIIFVAVPAAILSFLVWYRIRSLKHLYKITKMNPPTYTDLRKMSTIYDPDDIQRDSDTYNQASQEEYGITFMELQMMKTDID